MKIVESARLIAEKTPPNRNRYADFLRAFAILIVVFGHWLMAAPEMIDGQLRIGHLLSDVEWTRWATWLLQVMPVFFFVGGYANAISWRSARSRSTSYGAWIQNRLRRLVVPVLPVLGVWTVVAFLALKWNLDPKLLTVGTMAALVPVWFLAAYTVVVTLTPLTLRMWDKHGWVLVFGLVGIASVVDILTFSMNRDTIGYLNYLFVWGTVYIFGYAWADERMAARKARLLLAALGLGVLAALVYFGPYPVAMVGIDNSPITNSNPPKITNIALGLFQFGLALTLETPLRRWLERIRPWTTVVFVNGIIMTVYLWHLTAMVAVIGGLIAFDGFGLGLQGNTSWWWITRPVWISVMAAATLPLVAIFARFEHLRTSTLSVPPTWRMITGVVVLCTGLACLAKFGITDGNRLNSIPVLLTFVGAASGKVVSPRLRVQPIG